MMHIYIANGDDYTLVYIAVRHNDLSEHHEYEESFFKVVRNIIKATNPICVYGDNEYVIDEYVYTEKFIKKYLDETKVPYSTWILFLGPEYVKKFGKEKLLKTPALVLEEIANGVFMVSNYIWSHEELKNNEEILNRGAEYDSYWKILLKGQ